MRRKSVTMTDVAREANVSISTVSHVINKTAPISAETRERINDAIKRLNYIPIRNPGFSENIRTIGILVPDLMNEYYVRSVQSICRSAWASDYTALVCGMRHDQPTELKYIKAMIGGKLSGIIYFGGLIDAKYIFEASKHIPVVLGDRKIANRPIPSVTADNFNIMRKLVNRLARVGYTKIGFLSEDADMMNVKDRLSGFKKGMEDYSLPITAKFVVLSPRLRLNKITNSYRLIKELISGCCELPDVFLTTSDLVAIGAMAAFREAGFNIPDDIGIVGFDDISYAAAAYPPLTTISQNMRRMGRACFDALIRTIEGDKEVGDTVIDAKLVIRSSVNL